MTSIFHLTNQEIFVITAAQGEQMSGQVATWVMLATLIPEQLRVVVAISPFNFTNTLIQGSQKFALNLLAEGQEDWLVLFGLHSSREVNKFAGFKTTFSPGGLPLLPDTCGWAECRVGQAIDTGDRILYLADVVAHQVMSDRVPLREVQAFARLSPDLVMALGEKYQRDIERSRTLIKPLQAWDRTSQA